MRRYHGMKSPLESTTRHIRLPESLLEDEGQSEADMRGVRRRAPIASLDHQSEVDTLGGRRRAPIGSLYQYSITSSSYFSKEITHWRFIGHAHVFISL